MEFPAECRKAILDRLVHKSASAPHPKTCASKIKYVLAVLSALAASACNSDADFVQQIVEKIQPFVAGCSSPETISTALDKYILKICNRLYHPPLMDYVKNTSNPDIYLALQIIKFKYTGECNTKDILARLELASPDIKEKTLKVFEKQIGAALSNGSTKNKDSPAEMNKDPKASANEYDNVERYEKIPLLKRGVTFMKNNRLADANKFFMFLSHKAKDMVLTYVWHSLSLIQIYRLKYYEALYFIDCILKTPGSKNVNFYFLNARLLVERLGGAAGPRSRLKLSENLDFNCRTVALVNENSASDLKVCKLKIASFEESIRQNRGIKEHWENKLVLLSSVDFSGAFYLANFQDFNEALDNTIHNITLNYKNYDIISLFVHKELLYVVDIASMEAVEIQGWMACKTAMDDILSENTDILRADSSVRDDKSTWWARRSELDNKIKVLIMEMQRKIVDKIHFKNRHCILAVETAAANFPWEFVLEKPCHRVLSLEELDFKVDTKSTNDILILEHKNNKDTDKTMINRINSDTNNIMNSDINNIINLDTNNIMNSDINNIINLDTNNKINSDTNNIKNSSISNKINSSTNNIINSSSGAVNAFYVLDPENNLEKTRERMLNYLNQRAIGHSAADSLVELSRGADTQVYLDSRKEDQNKIFCPAATPLIDRELANFIQKLKKAEAKVKKVDSVKPTFICYKGITGRSITAAESERLKDYGMLLYFGHGAGSQHLGPHDKVPPHVMLFGCASARIIKPGIFRGNGKIMSFLKNRRNVLGMLWDVTDKDLDELTIRILDDISHGTPLCDAVQKNTRKCRMVYLNGSATVVYGAPPSDIAEC
ncbi:hypothetical protein ENBRE01_1105 [Enteropsectra breve]|nr:hypothetical protein ENBRE01_1105 [Enteropsectra breve]